MEGNKKKKFLKALPFIILVLLVGLICFEYINHATTDVGNVNRYPTGDGGGVGIGNIDGLSEIISYLIGLFIKEPMVGLILLASSIFGSISTGDLIQQCVNVDADYKLQ